MLFKIPPIKHSIDLAQILRFLIVGGLNTLLGLSVIFLLKAYFGLDDFVSNLIGYCIGLINSFFLNKKWTFNHESNKSSTVLRFIFAFLISYLANIYTVLAVRDYIGINSYLAQGSGIIPYTVIFYLTCRYYVFATKD